MNLRKKREIIKKILNFLEVDEKTEVSILFADDELIKGLNNKYRGINKTTDVLSFCFKEDDYSFPAVGENKILGDIIISIEKADDQAKDKSHSIEFEVLTLIVHGILHLLDYDHLTEPDVKLMFDKQDEILRAIIK